MTKSNIIHLVVLCLLFLPISAFAQTSIVSGVVSDEKGVPIPGATVRLVDAFLGDVTDEKGAYTISGLKQGLTKVRITCLGYKPHEMEMNLRANAQVTHHFVLQEDIMSLEAVTVTGKSVIQEIEEKAFNVAVVDAKALHGTSLDLAHALDRTSGVRVREAGGVGSQMSFSINGFRGNQVRMFIDGIPMDNLGSAFQLNNIPVGMAERIEVYKGVVPISLGADALGGAVNIVTNTYEKSHLDVSYSYGSFNTHRTIVNAIYVAPESGFTVQLNAFQNYSDNNYKMMGVDVADINTGAYNRDQTVERFHDTYHNETIIVKAGLVNKPFADQLLIGATLGQKYQEIQTGARVETVFGKWHRKGTIIMPSLKYVKNDLFTKGLNVRLNANYNAGMEQNIDTVNRRYNWFGQYKEYDVPGGERSYSLYKFRDNVGITMANVEYRVAHHSVALSNTFNTFNRKGEDELNPENDEFDEPRKNQKNILGLGYTYERESWNASVFMKEYFQRNEFTKVTEQEGYNQYEYNNTTSTFNSLGYGAALSWFVYDNLQLKASYEKSYRLPESNELFGDMINLDANIDLKPEHSHNYNLGASLWVTVNPDNRLNFNAGGFYRYAKDFIRARFSSNQVKIIMDNLGSVTNLGIDGEMRYEYKDVLNIGANITYQNLRNNTQYEPGYITESPVYRDRIPNEPYLFGNGNATYTFHDLWDKGHRLNIGYNLLYVHGFYLYWPSQGSDKLDIPAQISHDLTLTYILNDKLQLTAECRNLTNKKLYDNFSLQKPGRSFTGKITYNIF
ncbi:Outer membrane receptor proteins, mostly Fe transport [Reichenbachiella agariperforans]|uniref:Outer membrane receptor proteins, mostly Fe transport n=1 Tax=Reichenbachiella agariperforans TaxID=156994 RepID=A0A1M6UNQ5_REIAG|nr:TonB-dependent receptor [Reichenbachiella agariperforans]SHK70832.1 Outer membrane receptor proteins, mostly Fe transport [Reichenbachiella agariperforans]